MTETTALIVPMPHMGVSVEEGTVVEWHKAVGEAVAAEEVLCEIATDKVDTEVLSPADGVLSRVLAEVGDSVPVGEPLAELTVGADAARNEFAGTAGRGESERLSFHSDSDSNLSHTPLDEHGRFDPQAAAEAATSPRAGRKMASPLARRVAADHGVDLGRVSGTGRNGRIRKADVEAAVGSGSASAAQTAAAPRARAGAAPEGIPPAYVGIPHEAVATSRVRQAIAEHMRRSRDTAAHMTTEVDVDLSAVVRARTQLNAERGEAGAAKLSYLPFIARATCAALLEHPDLNATFLGERLVRWRAVNLGIAVDTDDGLLVPVVRDCERLTAPAIGEAIADLAERARTRKLAPDDLAGGTFTLSNPGSVGAVSAPAIINLPQVAILGIPTIQRRPWVIADEHGAEAIAIRPILRLAVTFDHRALDGADATRFAVAVKDRLEAWGSEAYS
ncbi:MAG TPA: dihydrolipoamide acetyltransferase family protein [Solirubrobacterales bacterium]